MKFDLILFFQCLFGSGHVFTNSKSKRGFMTCTKCGYRRKWS